MRFITLILFMLLLTGTIYLYFAPSGQKPFFKTQPHQVDAEFSQEIAVSTGNWVENTENPIFDNNVLKTLPQNYQDSNLIQSFQGNTEVLGVASSEKWLEVNLTEQKIYAWEGGQKIFEFPVSTGRPGYTTPTGEFTVWRKVKYQAYKGGSKERGDYYYLPNVPYSLFFYNDKVKKAKGYAVHGAYWHNDFGIKRRSSGCVNVKPENAAQIYYWANPVTPEGVNAINTTNDNPGVRVSIHY